MPVNTLINSITKISNVYHKLNQEEQFYILSIFVTALENLFSVSDIKTRKMMMKLLIDKYNKLGNEKYETIFSYVKEIMEINE